MSANGQMPCINQKHKRECDASPDASGNHYCPSTKPSAYPGTSLIQNGGTKLGDDPPPSAPI